MDAALDKVATAVMLRVCSGSSNPATRAAAVTATLASIAVDSGDFVKSEGTSGRKTTVGAQSGVSISASGDATCICLDDGTNLLYITTCTTQTLTSGGTVTVPAWTVQFGDPT
jgi:hypothetical protein